MVHNQATNFRTLATQFVPGSIALALATSALFGLRLDGIRLFDRIAPVVINKLAAVGGNITPERDEQGE
jgi:hypothetical protein